MSEAKIDEFPCIYPASREFPVFRDGFARDCLLQRRVRCELDLGEGDLADEIAAAPPGGFTCWRTRPLSGRDTPRRQARNFSSGVALACDEAGSEEYHRDRDLRRWRDTKLAAARNQWLESVPLQPSSAESEKNAMPVERRGPGLKPYPTPGPGRFEGEGDVIVGAQTLRVRTPGRLPRGVAMHRP